MKAADLNAAPSEVAGALSAYGRALLVVDKPELAVDALMTALVEPSLENRLDSLMAFGDACMELGRVADACAAFSSAMEEEEQFLDEEDFLSSNAYLRLRRAQKLEEGARVERFWPTPPADELDWSRLGEAFGRVHSNSTALETFAQMLPGDAALASRAWWSLGRTYASGSLAIAAFERGVALTPEDTDLIEELSACCAMSGQIEKACYWSRRLVEVIRVRRERNSGRNDSKYVLVGDLLSSSVVRIDSDQIVFDLGLKKNSSIPIADFKSDCGEVEVRVGDFATVVVQAIEVSGEVLYMDADRVLISAALRSGSYIPLDELRNERGETEVKMGDIVRAKVDAAELGYGEFDVVLRVDRSKVVTKGV